MRKKSTKKVSGFYYLLISVMLMLLGGEILLWLSGSKPKEKPSEAENKEESESFFRAELKNVNTGEVVGQVSAIEDPYRGGYEYFLTLEGLTVSEEPAYYEVWYVFKGDIIASQGKLNLGIDGKGILAFKASRPNVADRESVAITYEPDDNDPAPGTLIIEGIFEEVRD